MSAKVTKATTLGELAAMLAPTTTVPTTTAAPTTTATPMGLSTGTVPAGYVQYPTYEANIPAIERYVETSAFPGAPASAANKTAPGAGTKRFAYYVATTPIKGGTSPQQGPGGSSTGPMIGWPVVITGGSIAAGKIFKTTVDSYTTANDMTLNGYRYGSYTFSPEPPNYDGAYKFFFAPTVKGGRRGSRRGRKGRKATRRH